jgi:hypothetical protein
MMPVAIMLVGMTLGWVSSYRRVPRPSKVRTELAEVGRRILGAGIIFLMALMPLFRSSGTGTLTLSFAAAASICLALAVTLHVWRGRIRQSWEASMKTLVIAWSQEGIACVTAAPVAVPELRPAAVSAA